MHLNTGDLSLETGQYRCDTFGDPFAKAVGPFNVVIGVNLNLHVFLLLKQPHWLMSMIDIQMRIKLTTVNLQASKFDFGFDTE
jgi:hypothetical protein